MRPESIRWFERVYIGRIILGVSLSLYLMWWRVKMLGYFPSLDRGIGLRWLVSLVGGCVVQFLLFYFIARRASTVAKWIFVVLTVIGVIPVFLLVIAPNFLPAALKMGPLFGVGLDFTMIMLLFQPDSRAWFERRGVIEEDYADTFS
jgi:hypothetical protein